VDLKELNVMGLSSEERLCAERQPLDIFFFYLTSLKVRNAQSSLKVRNAQSSLKVRNAQSSLKVLSVYIRNTRILLDVHLENIRILVFQQFHEHIGHGPLDQFKGFMPISPKTISPNSHFA
jgi:hypothetical protein